MAAGITGYRALTAAAEALLRPCVKRLAPRGGLLRASFSPPDAPSSAARGSVWIHAASMGEVVAARRWAATLADHGARRPFYLSVRTASGLARARRELEGLAVAGVAPFDGPRTIREALQLLMPARVDILETEIWPNWIREARRARVPVVFVSATLSERSARGLGRMGVGRSALLREGVWVLAQAKPHADRFRALGVPVSRVAVVGDVKAEPPVEVALPPPFRRRFVVFGSMRPGEEEAAVAAALALERARPRRLGFICAPRHPEGARRARSALRREGLAIEVRKERDRQREPLEAWLDRLADRPGERVGLLATRGELAAAYGDAAIAVVGGTFAPYGGHNVLEPAARGCPIVVGTHFEEILPALEALAPEGAVEVVPDSAQLGALLGLLVLKPERLDAAGAGARRAAASAARAADRAYDALRSFGLAAEEGAAAR
jgi:3-deoxy-D-manno-octulosonic-acid transferase